MGGTIVACGFTLDSGHRPLSLIQGHSFYFSSDETIFERITKEDRMIFPVSCSLLQEAINFSHIFPWF